MYSRKVVEYLWVSWISTYWKPYFTCERKTVDIELFNCIGCFWQNAIKEICTLCCLPFMSFMNITAVEVSLFPVSVVLKRMQCNKWCLEIKDWFGNVCAISYFFNTALHLLSSEYSCKFSFRGPVANSRISKAKKYLRNYARKEVREGK